MDDPVPQFACPRCGGHCFGRFDDRYECQSLADGRPLTAPHEALKDSESFAAHLRGVRGIQPCRWSGTAAECGMQNEGAMP